MVAGKTVSAAGGVLEGEGDSGTVLARQSKDTAADIRTNTPNGHEQNVPKILSTLHNCISRLPRDLLRQVSASPPSLASNDFLEGLKGVGV